MQLYKEMRLANNLIERVGRIIKSNLNSLIESFENSDPEMIIAQATAEIDDALEEIRTELGRCAAAKHSASRQLQEEEHKHFELDHKIKTALMEDDEATASIAIEKQIDIESHLPVLNTTLSQFTRQEKQLEGYLKALASQKGQLHDELQYLIELSQNNPANPQRFNSTDTKKRLTSKIEKANLAFERVMEGQTPLMAQAEKMLNPSDPLPELEEMALRTNIQARLTAAKRRMKKND
jgi:phage shock protein A